MAIAFDGPNKLMVLSPGTVSLSVVDLWSRWVDWCLTSDNSKYLPAMRSVGGDPMSADAALMTTFFLINGWRVQPQEANHTLVVSGNLFTEPSGFSPFVHTVGDYNVMVSSTVSSITEIIYAEGGGGGEGPHDDEILANTAALLLDTADLKADTATLLLDTADLALDTADLKGDTAALMINAADILLDTAELKGDTAGIIAGQSGQATSTAVGTLQSTLDGVASDVTDIHSYAEMIRKILTNKTVEDATGVNVYEDNGVDLFGRWSWSESTKTRGKLT